MSINFINDWTISTKDMPKYEEFHGEFIEPLDYHTLNLLYESDNPKLTPEIKTLLKNKVLDKMNPQTGELKVVHNPKHGLGRFYADEDISIIPHARIIKHTVFKYLGWLDIDMVKGHPTIAVEMAKQVGLSIPHFQKYIDDFKTDICPKIIQQYSCEETPLNEDDVKDLFNLMIYGGTFETWKNDLAKGKPKKGKLPKHVINAEILHPFIDGYKKECDLIMKRIVKQNPYLLTKFKKLEKNKDNL